MATNWTIRDRWNDICRGVAIGAIIACSAIAYSPRLVSALHALGSPRPVLASAPMLASSGPDWLSPEERVQLEDTAALVERLRLPVTTRAAGAPPARHTRAAQERRDQIGELIADNQ